MKKNRDKKFREITLIWLQSAADDLRWAKASFEDRFYAKTCFVCQQVAEKVLKAYLFSQHQKLIKTHKLGLLLRECQKFNRSFEDILNACKVLTHYYTEIRYPDDIYFGEFDTKENAEEAIKLAQEVLDFVRKKLS